MTAAIHRTTRRTLWIYLLIGFLSVASIAATIYRVPRTLDDIAGFAGLGNINEVTMINGTTGSTVTSRDPEVIRSLLKLVNVPSYSRSLDQSAVAGYLYTFRFQAGSLSILDFSNTGNHIRINGIWYDLDTPIRYEAIDEWFRAACAAEEKDE